MSVFVFSIRSAEGFHWGFAKIQCHLLVLYLEPLIEVCVLHWACECLDQREDGHVFVRVVNVRHSTVPFFGIETEVAFNDEITVEGPDTQKKVFVFIGGDNGKELSKGGL